MLPDAGDQGRLVSLPVFTKLNGEKSEQEDNMLRQATVLC